MRGVRVARPTTDDAEALADLHLDVWDEAYAGLVPADLLARRRSRRAQLVDRWRDTIAESGTGDDTGAGADTLLVARSDERLLGFVSSGAGRDGSEDVPPLEVWALNVRAEAYGLGVGLALLEAAVGWAPAHLWVLDGNDRAVRFYEKQGFALDGTTKAEPVGLERRMVRRERAQ